MVRWDHVAESYVVSFTAVVLASCHRMGDRVTHLLLLVLVLVLLAVWLATSCTSLSLHTKKFASILLINISI